MDDTSGVPRIEILPDFVSRLKKRTELVVKGLRELLEGGITWVQLVGPELRVLDWHECTLGAYEDELIRILRLETLEHLGEALKERRHDFLGQPRHRIAGLKKAAILERRPHPGTGKGGHVAAVGNRKIVVVDEEPHAGLADEHDRLFVNPLKNDELVV